MNKTDLNTLSTSTNLTFDAYSQQGKGVGIKRKPIHQRCGVKLNAGASQTKNMTTRAHASRHNLHYQLKMPARNVKLMFDISEYVRISLSFTLYLQNNLIIFVI